MCMAEFRVAKTERVQVISGRNRTVFANALSYMYFSFHPVLLFRPKNTRVFTNPTDLVFFVPTLQFLLPSRKTNNKKIFIPTDPKMFQKIRQKSKKKKKMSELLNLCLESYSLTT